MGILFHARYWGRVINRIEERRSMTRKDTMSRDDCVAIMVEACRAFSDLVDDPEFESDIQAAVGAGFRAMMGMPDGGEEFHDFVRRFQQVEREALRQAGVSERATVQVEGELSELLRNITDSDLAGVTEKIRRIRHVCCEHADDPKFRNDPPREFSDDVGQALIGTAAVGVDTGTMVFTGKFLDAILGASISTGFGMYRPLLKRIW